MPSHPNTVYKHDGWQGCGHWLGTGTVAHKDKQFLPFKEALLRARSLKLTSNTEWREWCKTSARPANIPSRPDRVFKHAGWQGYGHWLGTGAAAPKDQQFLPFKKALLHARSLKLKSEKEWREWREQEQCTPCPANIPSTPARVYKHDGWQGHGQWLGTS